MTCFELGVMLHYYARVDDCEAMLRNPPIWPETIHMLLEQRLLEAVPSDEKRDAAYRITERGKAFAEALQLVPLPTQHWRVDWPDSLPMAPMREFYKAFGM